MSLKKYAKKLLTKGGDLHSMISNFDFYDYVDKSLPIIVSSELPSCSYEDLFDNPFKAAVILIENNTTNHWVLLNKYKNTHEYFDSYGQSLEHSPIAFIKDQLDLKKVTSNKTQFQEYAKDLNTCGKHILFRLLTLLEFKMNIKKNNVLMNKLCEIHKETPDHIVKIFITL